MTDLAQQLRNDLATIEDIIDRFEPRRVNPECAEVLERAYHLRKVFARAVEDHRHVH